MTQKKTMTKNEAREFLLGRYIKATGSFELSKVVDHLHKFGCTGMNDSQIEAVGSAARGQKITTHVGDFHNDELRIFCTYGPITTFMNEAMEELSLSDLLAIEIVEEPDNQASASIRAFVKTVKDEFSDMNLEYLDFVADRFIMDNANKIEPDHRALLEEAVKLMDEAKSRVWYWQTMYQKKHDDPVIGKIEQFLEANKTIPKSK